MFLEKGGTNDNHCKVNKEPSALRPLGLLLPTNHKNYNFREKIDKGGVNSSYRSYQLLDIETRRKALY